MSKRNMRRIVSLLLVLAMCLSLVATTQAAKEYTDDVYTDVKPGDWFYENVAATYEHDLMIGKGNRKFAPNDYVTVAETLAIAARLHSNGAEFVQGNPWYQVYADYVEKNGIADLDGLEMNDPADRKLFVTILANALPEDAFEEINFVADGAIPDVPMSAEYAEAVYKLYRAGILIGNDAKGTFAPKSKILRREVAAIITRMVDEALRLRVELGEREQEPIDDPIPEETEYTVEFLLNFPGNDVYLRKTVEAGETVAEPLEPTRAEYFFDGWYLGEDEYDFDTPVTGDLELVAHWKPDPYRPIMPGDPIDPIDPIDPDDNRTVKAVLTENDVPPANGSTDAYEAVKKQYTLTFYYDEVEYTEGENGVVEVYTEGDENGLPTYLEPVYYNPEYYGETYLDEDLITWGWYADEYNDKITAVVITPDMADYTGFTSMALMFYYLRYAESIEGAENLNTSNVTTMSYMFYDYGYNSKGLTAVPEVSGWDTSKVKDMSYMFYEYGYKSTVLTDAPNVRDWKTPKVKDMSYMFYKYGYNSTVLTDVPNVRRWKTSKVIEMNSMFESYGSCSKVLTDAPEVGKWNTSQVTDMSYMFKDYGCDSTVLTDVPDVSKWKTSQVTDMGDMFSRYGYQSTVLNAVPDVSKWDTSQVEDMDYMFSDYGYKSTVLTDAPNVSDWDTSKVTNMVSMFAYYGSSSGNLDFTLDLRKWDTSAVTMASYMFEKCASYAPTWTVMIPAKSKDESGVDFATGNDSTHFYYGASYNGNNYIKPCEWKTFTLPGPV